MSNVTRVTTRKLTWPKVIGGIYGLGFMNNFIKSVWLRRNDSLGQGIFEGLFLGSMWIFFRSTVRYSDIWKNTHPEIIHIRSEYERMQDINDQYGFRGDHALGPTWEETERKIKEIEEREANR